MFNLQEKYAIFRRQTDRHYHSSFISFFLPFVHSVVCLATGPQPFPKRVLHRVRFTLSSPFLKIIEQLLTSSSSSRHSSFFSPCRISEGSPYARCDQSRYTSFSLPYVRYSFRPWHCVILVPFSHDWSNWSFPSLSSTTFQTFQVFLTYLARCPCFSTIQIYAWSKYRFCLLTSEHWLCHDSLLNLLKPTGHVMHQQV